MDNTKYIGVTTLTFHGQVTSSVTWPFNFQVAISYKRSIVTKSLSRRFRDTGPWAYWGYDFDLSGSRDVIGHVTIRFPGGHFVYRRSIVTKSLSPAISEILGTKNVQVTTLIFQGHETSSVTWPFNSRGAISYWWSFGPESLSL